MFKKIRVRLCIALIAYAALVYAVWWTLTPLYHGEEITYSQFMEKVALNDVSQVGFEDSAIVIKDSRGKDFVTGNPAPYSNGALIARLQEKGVDVQSPVPGKPLGSIFIMWFPMLLLVGVWVWYMNVQQGGAMGRAGMLFGKSKARLLKEGEVPVTFDDVAGCEEAKEEVKEVVDFLKDPSKFQKLHAQMPRGVLMVGPPGTGKTLLARAIAGEAKVPFFTISGADFVEMFVGVGAARVRDMFEQAKKAAPCIIFIDEIDAAGRSRGAGLGGGHDEKEQTLNQLLTEMDGFTPNAGIIVIAATNRPDVLDKALLRPGRFDRQVTIGLPDVRGREAILKVHLKDVPVSDDADLQVVARGIPGSSGADIKNLVNEAAILATRDNQDVIGMRYFEKARDKIFMGPERKGMVMSKEEKLNTAYHEAGHAIVGKLVPEHDPVHKVSIIPHGRALGITMFLPECDQYSISKQKMESQISSLFGGRIAEEMILGKEKVTTGASNDIERATEIARNMVTRWGFSSHLGPIAYAEEEGEVFLGRSVTMHKSISEETARKIDEEIRAVIDRNYGRAERILEEHRDKLDAMTELLLRDETIDANQIDEIMNGVSM
ncbi:MAG: ATP-dependent metallopeptidase FtsH/Yme1/Tma family protein [Parcubacteria group bacterium]|nr:ATP-dependent metallopeptidase FtsH/Yme1/Tma family protein [Parcubacteria group bacterium]